MKSLSNKMEVYCQERAKGNNQAESYKAAYPTSSNWVASAVYARASELEKQAKIQAKIKELKRPAEKILQRNRNKLIQKAIDIALGKEKPVSSTQTTMLAKLLDKILPTMSQVKNENHNKTFEDFLKELQN